MKVWAYAYAVLAAVFPVLVLWAFSSVANAQTTGAPTDYTKVDVVAVIIIAVGFIVAILGYINGKQR